MATTTNPIEARQKQSFNVPDDTTVAFYNGAHIGFTRFILLNLICTQIYLANHIFGANMATTTSLPNLIKARQNSRSVENRSSQQNDCRSLHGAYTLFTRLFY